MSTSLRDPTGEEPMPKRLRHRVISEHVYSEEFEELLQDRWCSYGDVKTNNLEVISKPFRICKISNFLASEEFIDGLKTELLDVKCRRSSIDLYQFEQTRDLAYVDSPILQLLYTAFQIDLAIWMERNTKIQLNNKISMSSSCYCDTDYLLCHDDNMGERRIAYILYLSKDWTSEDGGALDLFDTDEHGLPRNVVRSLVPEYNSLVFFEVVDNSYHQVAEVTSAEKSRWTINGWFEGPIRKSQRLPRPDLAVSYIEPMDSSINLNSWITKCYLFPGIVTEIQQDIEQESYTFLSNFLIEDIYKKLSSDIVSDSITWKKIGPADARNYEVADEATLPPLLKDFYSLFKSKAFFQLLKDYTELDLVSVNENMKPKMTIELQRWSRGCYTLISDKSMTKEGSRHDNRMGSNQLEEKKCENQCETSKANEIRQESKESKEPMEESKAGKSTEDSQSTSKSGNTNKKNSPHTGCNTPLSDKEYEDIDEEDTQKRSMKKKLKKIRPKKKETESQTSSSELEDSPSTPEDILDRNDSEVSDIGDYLSDPLDYLMEVQDDTAQSEDVGEPGSLDVIMQFCTGHVPEEQTIDYVDPKEKEGALIHVPPKDNHLCLVYKTLSTCRVHKYVNHYCKDYFYNLVCTYYE